MAKRSGILDSVLPPAPPTAPTGERTIFYMPRNGREPNESAGLSVEEQIARIPPGCGGVVFYTPEPHEFTSRTGFPPSAYEPASP